MVKLVSHPRPRLEPPVVSLVEINVSAPVRKTTSATYDGWNRGRKRGRKTMLRKEKTFWEERGKKEVSEIRVRIFTGSSDFTVATATQQEIRTFSAAAPACLPCTPPARLVLMSIMAIQQGDCNQSYVISHLF